jgi:hypothetical protein
LDEGKVTKAFDRETPLILTPTSCVADSRGATAPAVIFAGAPGDFTGAGYRVP